MGLIRLLSVVIALTCVSACGGGGGSVAVENSHTVTQTSDTNPSTTDYTTSSDDNQTGQIYVIERLSLGPQKRISDWADETYQAQITLDHVSIDENGTLYGAPTPNPATTLHFSANGTATGYLVHGNDAYKLNNGNVVLSLNSAQGGTITLDGFNVTPFTAGQPNLDNLTIDVTNIAYLGVCGSADFCSNAATYTFTSDGNIPDGTRATGVVLGGIFGPNGENAGALLGASNENIVEFRGDFVANRSP